MDVPVLGVAVDITAHADADTSGARGSADPSSAPLEVEKAMDGTGETGPYPFASTDLDIDMMDKVRTGTNGPSVSPPVTAGALPGDPAELAQQVAGVVQGLAERVRELEGQRQRLEQQVATQEASTRSAEALMQKLRENVLTTSVSADDLQTIQRVLEALSRDPNHIMVLASVAQQAAKITAVVDSFARLHRALQQAPPS